MIPRGPKLQSARKFFLFLLTVFLFTNFSGFGLLSPAFAEGTRTWEQSKFDELTKGTATGVAIRNSGGLELAPTFKSLYATPSTYIWAIVADDSGVVYAAAGAPARVYRITPDGKTTIIFEPKELQVQALQIAPGGAIYAATAPDGKVYKIEHKAGSKSDSSSNAALNNKDKDKDKDDRDRDKDAAKPVADPSWTSSIYFEPATKYIWDLALDKTGNLYVATGDRGEIFRVTPKGEHSVFFKSDETHIRVLAFDEQGNLIAGSDGSGLIYRISPAGDGFVLYSAPKKEITALAIDRTGNIYAAAVGEKRAGSGSSSSSLTSGVLSLGSSVPTGGSTPQVPGMTITLAPTSAPNSSSFPFPGGSATGGSDVYRVAPDGSPTKLWTSREDIVYALAFDSQSRLLAGTGNRGHIFAVTGQDDFADLLKAAASQVTAFAKAPGGALYASTSNLGKVFILGPGPGSEGTYESDVFDARIFSRWGSAEFRGVGNVDLYARSGNVDNPDRNWSPWRKVDVSTGASLKNNDSRKNNETEIPAARYAQWKAVLHSGNPAPRVDSVALNYLPKNVAPEIDEITVQVGTKYQPFPKNTASSLGSDSSPLSSGTHFEVPTPSSHDRDSIGVKWSAHDDNDDQLVFSIYYRGDGDSRWLLLKDNLTDKAFSFDASLLPDGGYVVKVVASDAPSHSPGDALTASKESHRFEVDTTPPRLENLSATLDHGAIHISFRASDSFSPVKRAEYSVDAGDWKYVEPVGQLSDAKTENYDFKAVLDSAKSDSPKSDSPKEEASSEHVVVVRVYDRYDNMGAAKTVIPGK
jgi:hypothetical protein